MAAEMLTVDWRGRRYHHRRQVWPCLSRSLRGRGPQFHHREEERGSKIQSSINDTGEEPLCPCRGCMQSCGVRTLPTHASKW